MPQIINLKELLKKEHKGFSGLTHWLIAIFLFFCMWLIPWDFANKYINAINSSYVFSFLIFLIIGGSALLPDLDSSPLQDGGSTAVYQLGILGNALSTLAIIVSGIVYSLFKTRYDEKPKSQHRMLFHTFLIPLLIYFFNKINIPNNNTRLFDNLNINSINIFIIVFFAGVSVYLGSNMLMYKLLKLVKRQKYTQHICLLIMITSICYMFIMPYSKLRLIGESIALGYFFHILGDLITKGSSPVLFPIPLYINKHFVLWHKPYILGGTFNITTGGVLNIVLNFVFMGADMFLAWIIFIK